MEFFFNSPSASAIYLPDDFIDVQWRYRLFRIPQQGANSAGDHSREPPFLCDFTAVLWKNLMRSVRDALFAFVLAALLTGPTRAQIPVGSQEDARAEVVRKRRLQYPDLVKVADLAQSAPAELAADVLLRVAASERNQDRAWKIELLEDSFQMAALARQPNRQKIIGSRVVDRSRAEILSLAFDQRLDRLSLQSRVIRQMFKLDKAKALDMFQRTTWPSLRRCQCRDALVDHVAEYYELVAEIVASAFTAEQRHRGDHVDLVSYQISRISSPVEVGPAAKLLSGSTLTQDELSLLSGRLAASIDRIESDDRSFSASLGTADEALNELARNTRRQAGFNRRHHCGVSSLPDQKSRWYALCRYGRRQVCYFGNGLVQSEFRFRNRSDPRAAGARRD